MKENSLLSLIRNVIIFPQIDTKELPCKIKDCFCLEHIFFPELLADILIYFLPCKYLFCSPNTKTH